MSTEAIIVKLKTNNIAQQALDLLEKFARDKKLNVLPKFLAQSFHDKDNNYKTHAEQKKPDLSLFEELKKSHEFDLDFELLKKHHNRRIDNLYNPDRKRSAERSTYEQLVRDAANVVFKNIKTCIQEVKPIKPEINYFYILYNLNDLLLNYWDIKNRLSNNTHFKENLIALYSLNLQIQMCLEGFKKVLPENDALKKILEIIGFNFWAEEINNLKKLIENDNNAAGKIRGQAERLKPQQTAAYPTLNIPAKEFENYQQELQQKAAYKAKVTSLGFKYRTKLGFPPPSSPIAKPATAPAVSPLLKPATAPVDAAGNPILPANKRHNYTI